MSILADDQLAPGFLIAPPSLADPNFDETLVLLATHDDTGATGFIINREASFTLYALLDDLEIDAVVPDQRVLLGGPVSTLSGFVLYRHPKGAPGFPGIRVTDTVSVSASRDLLEACAQGQVRSFDLLLGCAGWGSDQLEAELERGSWLHSGYDEELLFDVGIAERYQEAYSRLGVSPWGFVDVKGGAQA